MATKQDKSFTAEKCLLYKDNFDGIIEGKLRPPIEVALDPVSSCTLNCIWCNAKKAKNGKTISKDKLLKLIDILTEWGVKGICFAGGGEPSLHPNLSEVIDKCTKLGIETAMITNGYSWADELIVSMARNMRWVGISVDASYRNSFVELKGVDGFYKVTDNICKLVKEKKKLGSRIGITYKFLIHPDNQHDIVESCRVAKSIGCDAIHLRPVDFLSYQDKEDELDVEGINKDVEKAKIRFEDDDFQIVPFFANFNKELKRNTVTECILTPLLGLCTPNGWYVCVDRRGDDKLRICKDILKIREHWGSKEHLELLRKIKPKKECGKCTMSKYYPYFYDYRDDKYYWKFS